MKHLGVSIDEGEQDLGVAIDGGQQVFHVRRPPSQLATAGGAAAHLGHTNMGIAQMG